MPTEPQSRCDLFISYARVDNDDVFGVKWVSALLHDLRNLLAQKIGRHEQVSIWWDDTELRGNDAVTPKIEAALRQTATFLMILSPGYLASQWCLQEKDLFFAALGGAPQGRVFVVEKTGLDTHHTRPAELTDLKAYQFWYRDEQERVRTRSLRDQEPHATVYIRLVEDLATDISRQIKAQTITPTATVFLAEVTDDLEPQRAQVQRYLEQEGPCRVMPVPRHLEGQAFRDALEQGLGQSQLFIQLLGAYPGRRPPDIPQGYTRLQLERAQARGVRIMQWHDPTLQLDAVKQPQRQLLEAVTVYAEPLETFKQRLVQVLRPPAPEPTPPEVWMGAPVVFIHTERRDRDLAESLVPHVDPRLMVTLPLSTGRATEVRRDRARKLCACDALLLVYGAKTLAWVEEQLLDWNRLAPTRERPVLALGVYDGPPEDKPALATRMPGLQILQCRQEAEVCVQQLQAFLAPLLQQVQP
jgi:hypothetical protein